MKRLFRMWLGVFFWTVLLLCTFVQNTLGKIRYLESKDELESESPSLLDDDDIYSSSSSLSSSSLSSSMQSGLDEEPKSSSSLWSISDSLEGSHFLQLGGSNDKDHVLLHDMDRHEQKYTKSNDHLNTMQPTEDDDRFVEEDLSSSSSPSETAKNNNNIKDGPFYWDEEMERARLHQCHVKRATRCSPHYDLECDHHEHCKEWAQRGECQDNPKFMSSYCQLSCQELYDECWHWAKQNECQYNPIYMNRVCAYACLTLEAAQQQEQQQQQQQRRQEQQQQDQQCSSINSNSRRQIIYQKIGKSREQQHNEKPYRRCDREYEKCDLDEFCIAWAHRGECTTNPKYMISTCALSCAKLDQ